MPVVGRSVWFFVARKTHLVPPGQFTDRFTHLVRLVRREETDEWVVEKKVPDAATIQRRLKLKFPEVADDVLARRANKFAEKIFPVFLTREAAILRILQDYLPAPYRTRVPRVIDMEKDHRGFVQTFRMSWLRNSGRPISQMEFARQSADLLRVIHDVAHVIHLDLRMDNMVITDEGVGFVDFGSAVREDEDLQQSPLLSSLFGELMKTSQIQRMLEKMTVSGAVTSEVIRNGYQKVDKAVDFFYLAVQFNQPHDNPELAPLIQYDPMSVEATDLRRLTDSILRPRDPHSPAFRSAKDIMHGIERMMLRLDPPGLGDARAC
jgi:tRNA A-37 threonylcarbamoyl transferase component Bud32